MLVRVGAAFYGPPHLSCEMGIHTWEPEQMELAAKVEKLRPSKGQNLAPCAPNSLEGNPNMLMPSSGHVHDTSIQNTPTDGVWSAGPCAQHWAREAWDTAPAQVEPQACEENCELHSRVIGAAGYRKNL